MDAREGGISHKVMRATMPPLIVRHFTDGREPLEAVEWHQTTAIISGEDGKPVFEQRDIEAPVFWSQQAVNVVASKYFRGKLGTPERESSVRHMILRVVEAITHWGRLGGYFATDEEALLFQRELSYLLVYQMASFNSPVWFNVGVEPKPQCSACFILKVEDNMDSILEWYRQEGVIFKHGSGAGVNVSALRSKHEGLSAGGKASGPLSFMKAADASAGVIKSGGKTRRAAKMVILNVDHPDILDFIRCKTEEEKKARILEAAGYSGGIDGEAVSSVAFQNANNSVRVSDDFMRAVQEDQDFSARLVTTGDEAERLSARGVFHAIAQAAWECGDPGIQFDDTINRWHTCPGAGRINASNPCSEYMHLDNSACNLASINLIKFRTIRGFDVEGFQRAVDLLITAQDIIVDRSSYPTPEIERNARRFRQLGLGYANLGAHLMANGLPYDSEGARGLAAAITALMTGEAYLHSARIASRLGSFDGYERAMLEVIELHGKHAQGLALTPENSEIALAARAMWGYALQLGQQRGFRNSQATVIAPTGTIAFMMDCDTTGIEPDIALVKYKKLVGGGQMKIVNQSISAALQKLLYSCVQTEAIKQYIAENDTIEGCPWLESFHLPVFDCAFKPRNGERAIDWRAHVKMVAAVQPFLSGAVSKTVNMPAAATVADVEAAFEFAWEQRLKAIAIYRDGSKTAQPLSTGQQESRINADVAQTAEQSTRNAQVGGSNPPVSSSPIRHKLPNERAAVTKKFNIAGHEGYITAGLFEDGKPGELFVKMSKQGSTIAGLMDAFSIAVSFAFQYGVPLEFLVKKFSHLRFEPSGFTGEEKIKHADSVVDYIFRWLEDRFLKSNLLLALEEKENRAGADFAEPARLAESPWTPRDSGASQAFVNQLDAPPCSDCGCIMVRNGACFKCLNCGSTSGCS